MRKGTRVGQAYVAVTADGSGINKDIVDDIDKASGDIGDSGDRAGHNFGDGFSEGFEERLSEMFDRMGDKLSKRVGASVAGSMTRAFNNKDADGLGARIGTTIGEALAENMETAVALVLDRMEDRSREIAKEMRSAGGGGSVSGNTTKSVGAAPDPSTDQKLVRTSIEFGTMFEKARVQLHEEANGAIEAADAALVKGQQALLDGLMKDEIARTEFVGKFENALRKVRADSTNALLKDNEALAKMQQTVLDGLLKDETIRTNFAGKFADARVALQRESDKNILKLDTDLLKDQEKLFKDLEAANEKMWAQRNLTAKEYTKYLADIEREVVKNTKRLNAEKIKDDKAMWAVRNATAKAFTKLLAEQERGVADEFGNRIKKVGASDSFSEKIGNILGKGSRSNALNLVGSSVSNVIGLVSKIGPLAKSVFATFSEGALKAGADAGAFARAAGGMGAVFARAGASIAATGPLIVAAIFVIVAVASVLVSVLSAILAIVVALAATITSALVGALAVAAGALGAVAVAGGLVAVAFTSMTDAQKSDMAETFQPLKAMLTGIGQLMITQIIPYFDTWSGNLQKALYQLAPLAGVFGDAIGRAGNRITESLSGPGFALLTQQLAVFLPSIVKNLASALGGFLNGAAGVFAALLPTVQRFAIYLSDVGARFSAFASSARGQNSIKDFVDRAVVALQSLFGFLKQVGGLIADVLFSKPAQGAGNRIFDSLAGSVKSLRGAISDGKLEKWMEDGIAFGKGLKRALEGLVDILKRLNNSGVLKGVIGGMKVMGFAFEAVSLLLKPFIDTLGFVGSAIEAIVSPIDSAIEAIGGLSGAISSLSGLSLPSWLGGGGGGTFKAPSFAGITGGLTSATSNTSNALGLISGGLLTGPSTSGTKTGGTTPGMQNLIDSGNAALNSTSESNGGYLPDPDDSSAAAVEKKAKEYVNPYTFLAMSILAKLPSAKDKLRDALVELQNTAVDAIKEAALSSTIGEARSLLTSQAQGFRDEGKSIVSSAQDALGSAAETLLNASNKKDAKAARKAVTQAKRDLADARETRQNLIAGAAIIAAQKTANESNIQRLVDGLAVSNATLADYAAARERVAVKIDKAEAKLEEAISLRDSYKEQVISSVKAFGSLITAQAKTINGVAQALTAIDIVDNLKDRLAKIQAFNNNLRTLVANGLSNTGYQALVDAGVEGGAAYAQALVEGGPGAIGVVNDLTGQIDTLATQMGADSSSRLYQAGVDAATGLVNGLNSQAAELDQAASRLGQTIANAVKRELGIASPSKVMDALMDPVGDGAVRGLARQRPKVSNAAAEFAGNIALAPSLADRYAAGQRPPSVSGNPEGKPFRDIVVHTPTTDPVAVGHEVINQIVEDLP